LPIAVEGAAFGAQREHRSICLQKAIVRRAQTVHRRMALAHGIRRALRMPCGPSRRPKPPPVMRGRILRGLGVPDRLSAIDRAPHMRAGVAAETHSPWLGTDWSHRRRPACLAVRARARHEAHSAHRVRSRKREHFHHPHSIPAIRRAQLPLDTECGGSSGITLSACGAATVSAFWTALKIFGT